MEEKQQPLPKWMFPPYKKNTKKARELTPAEKTSLAQLFYSPRTGFGSTAKLFKKARYIPSLAKVTEKQIKNWMAEQPVNETHYPRRKPAEGYDTITADGPGTNMQMDFLIYTNHPIRGYKYILCLIDVYSRYAACRATKNREGDTYTIMFKDMIEKDFGGVYPNYLNTDQEFTYSKFEELLLEHNVWQYVSDTDEERKNSIVERFNRSLRILLEKYRWSFDRLDWVSVLPDIVHNYNNRYHRTIGTSPFRVMNQIEPSHQIIRRVFNIFNVGDRVRIKKLRKTFQKGELSTLSNDVYIIEAKEGNKWQLKNLRTGEMYPTLVKSKDLKHANAVEQPEEEHPEEAPAIEETPEAEPPVIAATHENIRREQKQHAKPSRKRELEGLKIWGHHTTVAKEREAKEKEKEKEQEYPPTQKKQKIVHPPPSRKRKKFMDKSQDELFFRTRRKK